MGVVCYCSLSVTDWLNPICAVWEITFTAVNCLNVESALYEGKSDENRKYFLSRSLLNTLWNCRTSRTMWCADPWLISRCAAISFTVTWRFSFMMASTAAMPSGVTTRCDWPGRGESVTELMPFMNFLVHSYTCCSERHASPYWTFICWWISMGFTPSLLKKWMTERCSSLVHVASGAPFLHYYCAIV